MKLKLGPDWAVEKREKERSTSFRQAFRIEVRSLFSTKRLWGVGIWLRDAGRGLQESPESRGIADIAVIGESKSTTETPRHGEQRIAGGSGRKGSYWDGFVYRIGAVWSVFAPKRELIGKVCRKNRRHRRDREKPKTYHGGTETRRTTHRWRIGTKRVADRRSLWRRCYCIHFLKCIDSLNVFLIKTGAI